MTNLIKKILPLVISGSLFLGNCEDKENNKTGLNPIIISDKTTLGKFERTYRWDKILDEREEKYKIEKGLLKGLAMMEGYGDPLRLNMNGDGGAGLFQFQPGTAKAYGLDIYGNSDKMGKDKKHGRELKELISKNNYDYEKMAKIDERFDVYKSSEAAAKFLKHLYNRYGSWDKALSAYNRGTPVRYPCLTAHVNFTRKYQMYYNKRDN
ncbi:MAG: transglycosylase SLT domain-containing protein [Nanoarchaeota archaeon]